MCCQFDDKIVFSPLLRINILGSSFEWVTCNWRCFSFPVPMQPWIRWVIMCLQPSASWSSASMTTATTKGSDWTVTYRSAWQTPLHCTNPDCRNLYSTLGTLKGTSDVFSRKFSLSVHNSKTRLYSNIGQFILVMNRNNNTLEHVMNSCVLTIMCWWQMSLIYTQVCLRPALYFHVQCHLLNKYIHVKCMHSFLWC